MTNPHSADAPARPLASPRPEQIAASIVLAARDLLGHLAAGRRIDTPAIRTAMHSAFGASDAAGAWDWKAAYEALEVGQLLFVRRYGPAICARSADPLERLKLVERIARLAPTQTRRSEDMVRLQQFSTPLPLAWVAGYAAGFVPGERVLEPSAGTGLLAAMAELGGASLALNEIGEVRAALLARLFGPDIVSGHDAAQIHDRLDPDVVPTCVVMNPPFSVASDVDARVADAAFRHLSSAMARLADGGRLVAITGANCAPDHSVWRAGFERLQESARVVFSATIAGGVFAAHGTAVETRLTVIDKLPAEDARQFPASPGMAPDCATLLRWLIDALPPRRDQLIEQLAALEPVQGALDQIIQRFGTDMVAEVTGRLRRIVRKTEADGERMAVENRPAHANLAEAQAFMEDQKQILVFSDAGGTGRSYHADLGSRNRRLRHHYLLEAGWKADTAIQGLGRTNRTNQAQPPLFRPVATDVQAEKRFLSTIARRLDTLGAITRGQRQTGGQGLFRPEDNLESPYARDALRQFYVLIYAGKVEHCSLGTFEAMTGLSLTDGSGCLKDELPPITTFLNRLLALTIAMQNVLFAVFEQLLAAKVESAIAGGTYDLGLETLIADSFAITDARTIYTHPGTGAETRLLTIVLRDRNRPRELAAALELMNEPGARLMVNTRSKRAAVQLPARSVMLDDGEVERRVRLIRPMERLNLALQHMPETSWEPADEAAFAEAWHTEIAGLDEFTCQELHIVSGLLLPIWRRLPEESTRVYRLQTDDGSRIIGRRVSPAWAANALPGDAPILSPPQAIALLRDGHAHLDLQDGLQLRRSRLMQVNRIELTGFEPTAVDRLKAMGLFSEIVSWKLRLFVPDDDETGSAVLERLFVRHPLLRIADRKAA